MRHDGLRYSHPRLVRAALPWRYVGVTHEYLCFEQAGAQVPLPGAAITVGADGARNSNPRKHWHNIELLTQGLRDEPDNARYVYYLAQSYRDVGEYAQAREHFRRRAAMGGWPEEVWSACYQTARMGEAEGRPWPEVLADYLAAYQHSPDRAEPLYRIALHYQACREHATADLFLARAAQIPCPGPARLFVERDLYDYRIPIEHAVARYYLGDDATALSIYGALCARLDLPPAIAAQIETNRRLHRAAVARTCRTAHRMPFSGMYRPSPKHSGMVAG
jgi:tetratricopeptide (TPR) repeat protein